MADVAHSEPHHTALTRLSTLADNAPGASRGEWSSCDDLLRRLRDYEVAGGALPLHDNNDSNNNAQQNHSPNHHAHDKTNWGTGGVLFGAPNGTAATGGRRGGGCSRRQV